MPDENGTTDDDLNSVLNPAVLTMIADNLNERAKTLQNEAQRLDDESEQLRQMADELENKQSK